MTITAVAVTSVNGYNSVQFCYELVMRSTYDESPHQDHIHAIKKACPLAVIGNRRLNSVALLVPVWYGMVDACDGYLAAEASGSSFG